VSDFFRVQKIHGLEEMSMRELARQCHIAENTGDDILLMNVQDELIRREKATGKKFYAIEGDFMVEYRDLWPEFVKRKRKDSRA